MHQQHTAKVMGTLPLTKGSEKINHPGLNLKKEVKDLCSGNVTLLKKEREESDKGKASPARGLIELVLWKWPFIKSYLMIQWNEWNLKLLEENIGDALQDTVVEKDFLDRSPITQVGFIKLKCFCTAKEVTNWVKRKKENLHQLYIWQGINIYNIIIIYNIIYNYI